MEEYKEVCKTYINDKYVSDGIIAKEIYEYYPKITKEDIDEVIREKCYDEHVLYKIEKPTEIKKGEKECLYQTKQEIIEYDMILEGQKDEYMKIEYINKPNIMRFQIPYIRELIRLPIRLWKPTEIYLLENILNTIEILSNKEYKIKNYVIVRGYFKEEYMNVIIIPVKIQRKKIDTRKTIEEQEKEPVIIEEHLMKISEVAMIVDEIGNKIEEFKKEYLNRTRYMIVDPMVWQGMKLLDRPYEFKRGESDKCFMPIIGKDGIIIEKNKKIIIPNTIPIRVGTDVKNKIKYENYGLEGIRSTLEVNTFKTPIIKKKTIYRLKRSEEMKPKKEFKPIQYDISVVSNIMKWMRSEKDKKNLIRIYPSLIYNNIVAKTENEDCKYRVDVITNILSELDLLSTR